MVAHLTDVGSGLVTWDSWGPSAAYLLSYLSTACIPILHSDVLEDGVLHSTHLPNRHRHNICSCSIVCVCVTTCLTIALTIAALVMIT